MEQIVFTIKLVFVAKIKCEWDSGKDECTVAVKTIQNHIKRHLQFCKKARPHVATPPIGYNLYYNSSCAKPVCIRVSENIKYKNGIEINKVGIHRKLLFCSQTLLPLNSKH